jgi:hypothetical protein
MAARNQAPGVIVGIAGLVIRLDGLGVVAPRARRRYARFLSHRKPDLTLRLRLTRDGEHRPSGMPEVTRDGDGYQVSYGGLTARFAGSDGEATMPPSIWLVDSLLRMVVGLMLAERGGLLVHGSGVLVAAKDQVRALVCFGPSGVGKTTVARSVAARDVMCDEMIALLPDGRAMGTPFHGDYSVCEPLSAPLLAVVRLVHGKEDRLEPLSPAAAAQSLLNSTLFFCRDEALADRLLSAAIEVCTRGAYRLTFQRGTHVPTFVCNRLAAPGSSQASRAGASR